MATLAAAIVLVAILFLIDRNHVWPQAWKAMKRVLKVSGKIALVLLVGCVAAYGIFAIWGEWKDARKRHERDAKKARADKAVGDRWAELSSIEKDVCGDNFIYVSRVAAPEGYPDDSKPWPEYGVVGCTTHRVNHIPQADILPLSAAGCAALQNKIPTFSCKLPPPVPVAIRESSAGPGQYHKHYGPVPNEGQHHVIAKFDVEITTTEYGTLTCGHMEKGEVATLLGDETSAGYIKIKTATGIVGWAQAIAFEVNP